MGFFSQKSKEQKFWEWFSKNEKEIFSFEKDQEKILDSISDNLSKYKNGLVFEISQVIDGKREFIISADGIAELFPHVEAISKLAPHLERWTIIPFRPRLNDYASFQLRYAGKDLDPSKIWIYYHVEDGSFDLIVYHSEYSEEERNIFASASYILLDMALGEYDVVKGIRYIDHQRTPENPTENGLKPFSELRSFFDKYKNEYKYGK